MKTLPSFDGLAAAREQARSFSARAEALAMKSDPTSLREQSRLWIGVSYAAAQLEREGAVVDRQHWHAVGTEAEQRAASALERCALRRRLGAVTLQVIRGGRHG